MMSVSAAYAETGNDTDSDTPVWNFNSETGYITAYSGTDSVVTVPSEIDGVAVVGIGEETFSGNETIIDVVVSEGIRVIGGSVIIDPNHNQTGIKPMPPYKSYKGAFYKNANITNLIIPHGVEAIGFYAFYDCTGIEKVVFPATVSEIGARSF